MTTVPNPANEQKHADADGPLAGIRVLEMGQLLAGPFCSHMLAYFGAEVIKIEPPGRGDPIRSWRALDPDGVSWWWHSLGRNKHSVCINLNDEQGRELARELIATTDVLVENFRPGKMESWGMGPDEMRAVNPGLVYTRVSGYGQDGPYKSKPGFASACEAIGGFRHVNGFEDRPPVRPNLSIGDTLAGMHAVIGTLMALLHRQRQPAADGAGDAARGQVVDVSIFESVFNMLESVVPEYSGAGLIRQPSGSTLTGIVPTNTYRCADDKYVVIGGNGDSIFKRLMVAAGRADLAEDPRLADNSGRVTHEAEIDAALNKWASAHSAQDLLGLLDKAEVPAGPIYAVNDMFEDPHFRARGLFQSVPVPGGELEVPALHPRLQSTPGGTKWGGESLGASTDHILESVLGRQAADIKALRDSGVVG